MTLSGEFFRWQDGQLVSNADLLEEVKLAAADSWLVDNGRVRSIEAHYRRFALWVAAKAPELTATLSDFFAAVTAALPRDSRWFPRIELHLEGPNPPSLYLRLREAPEQLGEIRLVTYGSPDPRQQPTVKGPDLSLCMQLRRNAQMHSADETVLVDEHGFITEGALTAIVWFKDGVLCAPSHDNDWLDSVTRQEVFNIAKQIGIETAEVQARPIDLAGCEIWALSSLQGIRPVSAWMNSDGNELMPVGRAQHLESFSKRLKLMAAGLGESVSFVI